MYSGSFRNLNLGLLLGLCANVAYAKTEILSWDTLYLKESTKASDQKIVNSLNKRDFRVPGFMIPLENDPKGSSEFLLVPALPSCMHVPPPPPSQTIHVKMPKGERAKLHWDPIWAEGTLSLKNQKAKDSDGEAAYEMAATSIRSLKKEDMDEINKAMQKQNYVPDCNGRDKSESICKGK